MTNESAMLSLPVFCHVYNCSANLLGFSVRSVLFVAHRKNVKGASPSLDMAKKQTEADNRIAASIHCQMKGGAEKMKRKAKPFRVWKDANGITRKAFRIDDDFFEVDTYNSEGEFIETDLYKDKSYWNEICEKLSSGWKLKQVGTCEYEWEKDE